jgi:hypothetical protein
MRSQIVQAEAGFAVVVPIRGAQGRFTKLDYVPLIAWRVRPGWDVEPVTAVDLPPAPRGLILREPDGRLRVKAGRSFRDERMLLEFLNGKFLGEEENAARLGITTPAEDDADLPGRYDDGSVLAGEPRLT